MRWNAVFLVLLSLSCFGQEKNDSIVIVGTAKVGPPEWTSQEYTQEDKIYNRSVWTFADNPALAGFDRKLAISYRYGLKNLAIPVYDEDGNPKLGFQKHEVFVDLSLGGPKQNWGTAVYYSYEQELHHTIHEVLFASSHRIQFDDHHLTLGILAGFKFPDIGEWNRFTFSDMHDPRLGVIYPTNEIRRSGGYSFGFFGGGLKYVWKRLSIGYSVLETPSDGFSITWIGTTTVRNRIKANYHFFIGDEVTISPELIGELRSRFLFQATASHNGFFSAFATITYRDMVYGQLGVEEFSRMTIRAGYQIRDFLVIEIGGASYLDQTMQKIAGMASASVGIRYQIRPWYK